MYYCSFHADFASETALFDIQLMLQGWRLFLV